MITKNLYLLAFLCSACSSSGGWMEDGELREFISNNDNGLIKSNRLGDFRISLTYKPADIMVRQQIEEHTQKEYDSLLGHYSRFLYFTLEMTYKDKDLETEFASDPITFASEIDFMSTAFGREIKLTTVNDTTSVVDFVYTRSYGVMASQSLVVFEIPVEKEFLVEVNCKHFGLGPLQFSFKLADIINTPKLKPRLL